MLQHDWTYYAFLGGCVALAFFIRFKRLGKMQRLRLGTLWIIPAIFIVLLGLILWEHPPSGLDWLWIAVGLAAGGGIGWWRASQIEISVDLETGQLNQRSSMGALIVLGAIMAARWIMRMAVMWGDAQWHFGAMLISDIFIAMAVGALSAYRVELYLRALRLLRGT